MNRPVPQHRRAQQFGVPVSSGQLTYSSFDAEAGTGGGWQIKQVSDTLQPNDRELLRARVSTSLMPVHPMPPFPTPEEVESRPHRLVYAPVGAGCGAYWHTVPAGADGSGRPGNVFAHAFLDAAPPVAERRPIDLWRSPDWLVPFGAREVLAAELPPHSPRPGAVVDRDTVVDFLLDPSVWRVSLFSVLLDAVTGAVQGGPTVVFGTDNIDDAALWIGAVSHFFSKYAAGKFSWSTFERASDLQTMLSQGLHLIVVPVGDLVELVPSDRVVVLGESDELSRGEYRVQPNRTAAGAEIPVTRLSQIAEVVLIDPDVVRRVLHTRDTVAERVPDTSADPSWSLAMAIELENEADLSDAEEDCGEVILQFLPASLREYPDLHAVASAVIVRQTGTSPADALAALERTSVGADSERSVSAAVTLQIYLERALADWDWLVEAPPPPSLTSLQPGWAPPSLLELAQSRVGEMLDDCRTLQPDGLEAETLAVVALRLADLLVRARVVDEDSESMIENLQRIVEQTVPTIFFDDDRVRQFTDRVGPLDALTCRLVLQPVVVSLPSMNHGLLGTRLNRGFLLWAVRHPVRPRPLNELLAEPVHAGLDPDQILHIESVVAAMRSKPDSPSFVEFRPLCLAQALLTGDLDPQLESILFGAPGWDPRDLELLMRRFGDRLPPTAAWWTVLQTPMTPELTAIMEMVAPSELRAEQVEPDARAADPAPEDDLWRRVKASPERVPARAAGAQPLDRQPILADPVAPERYQWVSDTVHVPLSDALRQLVQLRRITTWDGFDRNTVLRGFHALTNQLTLDGVDLDLLPPDLQANLVVLQLAKLIAEPPVGSSHSWQPAQPTAQIPLPTSLDENRLLDIARALLQLCRSGVLDTDALVATAFLVSPSGPGFAQAEKWEQDLGRFGGSEGEYPSSLLDRVVEMLVAEQYVVWPEGPDQFPQSVLAVMEERHRADAEPPSSAYRRFLKRWLEARGVDSGGALKSLFRRRG